MRSSSSGATGTRAGSIHGSICAGYASVRCAQRSSSRTLNQSAGEELGESVFHTLGNTKKSAALRLEHAFANTVIQKDEELVVEAINVEQQDRFPVDIERVPGENFEELLEGTEAAGQRNESVRFFSDERLASMHGAGDVEFGKAVMRNLEINEDLGDDTDNSAVGGQSGFGNCFHEADVRSAVNETDIASGEGPAQLFRSGSVDRIDSACRSAENRDVSNHRDKNIKRGDEDQNTREELGRPLLCAKAIGLKKWGGLD